MKKFIHYKRLEGNREEKKQQFEKQLNKFEKDAKAGKPLYLTDLMINAEDIHLS